MAAPAISIQRVHWLTLLRQRGEPVTYTDGVVTLTNVMVVVTRPGEDQIDLSDGVSIESKQWDVLIDPETIKAGDVRIIPSQGHKITRADGTVYRVEPSSANRNCWRWSDAFETWRRVHTVIQRDK
jgi:hypothetical protein